MKLISKIVGATLGLAMAVGVGVGVAANNRKAIGLDASGDISITFPSNPSQKTNSYTKDFTQTHGGIVFTFSKWNNGSTSNSWTEIRGGQTNNAWTGTVTSGSAIASRVASVDVTLTQLDACNGSSLTVASNSSFTSDVQTITKAAGDMSASKLTYTVPNPATNRYYKLTFNQTASANGSIRMSQIDFNYAAERTLSSITLSGSYQTEFPINTTFNHDGMIVTANYTSGDHEVVTSSATWSSPDMTSVGNKTVTVSYTENAVTKTADYQISVVAGTPATGITLDENSGSLLAGQTTTLTAELEPQDATDEVVWTSSDEEVATVSNGTITTLKAGNATITATAGSVHADYALSVAYATSAQNFENAKINSVGTLIAKSGKNAIIDDGHGAFWAYANTSVSQSVGARVRVSGTSSIYSGGLEVNNATITTESGDPITPVAATPISSTQVDSYYSTYINDNSTYIQTRKVSLRTGIVGGSSPYFTWTYGSSLMETNYLTGDMEAGKAYDIEGYIFKFFTDNNTSNTYLVIVVTQATVVPVYAESISLNKNTLCLERGSNETLVSTLSPNGAIDTVEWYSSNTSVATVNQTGKVIAVAEGNATITAFIDKNDNHIPNAGELQAECDVTVVAPVKSLNNQFEADLTNTASVTNGFSIDVSSASKKTGYYQDGNSGTTSVFTVTRESPLFIAEPAVIEFTARIGAGSNADEFDNPIQVCFIDSAGNEISSTKVDVVTSNLTTSPQNYAVSIPYSENAYGVKLTHAKESGYNARFYTFGLSYSYADSAASVHGTETDEGGSLSVSGVYMKFNASIKVSVWNQLGTISNYGVMIFKRAASNGEYTDTETPVKDAYKDGKTLTVIEKGNGDISNPDGDYYNFSAKIKVSDSAKYNVKVCAAPFIVVDGTCYFLDEMEYSVHTLAQYCIANGGSNLSNEALALL